MRAPLLILEGLLLTFTNLASMFLNHRDEFLIYTGILHDHNIVLHSITIIIFISIVVHCRDHEEVGEAHEIV